MKYKKLVKKISEKIKKVLKVRKVDLYDGKKPLLSIAEICKIINIEVPAKYIKIKQIPIYETKLMNSLNNIQEIKSNIQKNQKYNEYQYLEVSKYLKRFKRKYYTQDSIRKKSDLKLLKMIIEWYYFFDNLGFDYDDYFDYELFNKDVKDLDKFLNKGYKSIIYKACNDKTQTYHFKNKAEFNKKFKKNVKREWIDARNSSFDEFKKFVQKYPRFFAKPIEGTGGAGAKIIEYKDDLKKLYKECVKNNYICEEIVEQHKDMAAFNESTLNTLRLYTLVTLSGKVIVTLGNARFGRDGNSVDNFHSGGVSAVIDLKTGKLTSDAINRAHIKVSHHPDSKIKFKGFQIPNFDMCKKAVCEAALMVEGVRHVGWDIAIASDGHIEFIEGNGFPNFDITQAADQIGKKDRYKKYIDELNSAKE